ncbi:MAG: hypothetical protein HYU36_09410 [Planctomycetes bacterium]|nr:hypothetical protein [Planctomycetota bacterium]
MKNPELCSTRHSLLCVEGTPRACGRAYGEAHAEAIEAFLRMEVPPRPSRLRYARRCWARLGQWERPVSEFALGVSEGSGRSILEVTLLLLHEEIGHLKRCTAFGAAGPATCDGNPVIGQNWDWSPSLYPWSSLLRARAEGQPATLTYAYPGLWSAAGLNEHGLGLVWTSSGLFPRLRPRVGIPTYALIAGLLTRRNCREALELLRSTEHAGSFIFLLADAEGEVWVVEGFPGRIETARAKPWISRANHYECVRSCWLTRQKLPRPTVRKNTAARAKRMSDLLRAHCGRIDGRVAEALLRDHAAAPGMTLCQHLVRGRTSMTLDSFYLLPARREMRIARGLPCRHRYQHYRV